VEYRWTSWEDLSAKEIRWLLQELQELRSQQNDSRAYIETA
jgi:ribulose bisphosphate carboxylase small subunit